MQQDILQYVPYGITLRNVQEKALLWYQQSQKSKKINILNMPVGAGKGHVAITIANYLAAKKTGGTAAVLVPTKILQDQFENDYPFIPLVKGMANYSCNTSSSILNDAPAETMSCAVSKLLFHQFCDGCPYIATIKQAQVSPVSIFNIHSYHSLDLKSKNIIIDEGHNIIKFLFDMASIILWEPEWKFDVSVSYGPHNTIPVLSAAISSLQSALEDALVKKLIKQIETLEYQIKLYSMVMSCLKQHPEDFLIVLKEMEYDNPKHQNLKGTQQKQIFIKPKTVKNLSNLFFSGVDNVVLLSATIGIEKMEELGFDANDVGIFESDSPIPTEKRPLYLYPVASMAYRHREASIPEMIKAINKISNSRQNVKGVIHCTYGTSAKMRTLLLDSRFMFHGKHDKQEVYEKFLKSKTPNILVACGMAEGIDLKYDLARFQIILEIMYPSLSDNVNYWRMHHMPRHFKMDAFDNMVQQYGRGCRAPDDHCETFVLDSQAVRLCEQVRIPGWLKSAIKRLG